MEGFEGMEELQIKLSKLMDTSSTKEAMGTSVAYLEKEAKAECPVDTGALRRSITSTVYEKDNEVIGEVFTPLEYAPWVHYGTGLFAMNGDGRKDVPWHYQDEKGNWHSTSGQKPNPFMTRALVRATPKIKQIFENKIKEVTDG